MLKLNRIEQQQMHLTQLVQQLLVSAEMADDPCDGLDNINLPVKTLTELHELEQRLEDQEYYLKLVSFVVV